MAKVGSITVEVRPTVTLESAEACVMMLNLFLADNDDYRLEIGNDGKWHLTDEPPMRGGIHCDKVGGSFGLSTTYLRQMKEGITE